MPNTACAWSKSSIHVDSYCHYCSFPQIPMKGGCCFRVSLWRRPCSIYLVQTQGSCSWMSNSEPVSNLLLCTYCVPTVCVCTRARVCVCTRTRMCVCCLVIHRWGDTPDVSSLLWGRGVQDLPGDMAGKSWALGTSAGGRGLSPGSHCGHWGDTPNYFKPSRLFKNHLCKYHSSCYGWVTLASTSQRE